MENTKNKDKIKGNDKSDIHKDEIGENTGEDTQLAKAAESAGDSKTKQDSSNKGQGPSGENL